MRPGFTAGALWAARIIAACALFGAIVVVGGSLGAWDLGDSEAPELEPMPSASDGQGHIDAADVETNNESANEGATIEVNTVTEAGDE